MYAAALGVLILMVEPRREPPPIGQRIVGGADVGWKLRFLVKGRKDRARSPENSISCVVILVGALQITTSHSVAPDSAQEPWRVTARGDPGTLAPGGAGATCRSPPHFLPALLHLGMGIPFPQPQ